MQRLGAFRGEVLPELRKQAGIETPGRRRPPGLLAAGALILAAAAAVHGSRVAHNVSRYHWEDLRFFRHSRTQIHSLADCFVRPAAWPGLYRPLSTNVYYFLGRKVFDNHIEPFHVVSAVFFVANGLLLFALARELLPGAWPLLPPVLFVSRSAHVQLATYGSEFQGLSSAFLALASIVLALRPTRARLALSTLAFALALLCKETAVVVPAILALHERVSGEPRRRWAPHAAVALLWAALFLLVFRSSSAWAPTGFAYDVSPAAVVSRYAAYLLVFSNPLVPSLADLAMPEEVPALARSPLVLAAFALLLAAEAAVVAAPRVIAFGGRAAAVAAFGFGWFLLAATPFVVLRDRLFMRYAYFAHAGLAIAVTAVLMALMEELRRRARLRATLRPATAATAAPMPP